MVKSFARLVINGKPVKARIGDTLLDAALGGRIVLPHDCCSGQCETCRVRVIDGDIDDQDTRDGETVLGCLATVEGDAEIGFDQVPLVRNTRAVVELIEPMGLDYLLVKLRVSRVVPWLPGQYLRLTFKGYPPRDYSPTFPFEFERDETVLSFHIRWYQDGAVSSALGWGIRVGHPVTVRGPFGSAFLRHQRDPLVLVSSGSGFAPIWAMAVSCVLGQPDRALSILSGAYLSEHLYMMPAIEWLRRRSVRVALTASDGDGRVLLRQHPADLLTFLEPSFVVYAAGAPSTVEKVRARAAAARSTFHADPFYPAEPAGLGARIRKSFRIRGSQSPARGNAAPLVSLEPPERVTDAIAGG